MKATKVIVLAGAALLLATGYYVAKQPARPHIKNVEAPGNLESRHDIGCVSTDSLSNTYTPADLLKGVSACVLQGKHEEGAALYALAGAYGRFDTLRVSDKTAHQAFTILLMQSASRLPQNQVQSFQADLKKAADDPHWQAAVCRAARRIGPPGYHPRYMIQHGLGAFGAGGDGGAGLVKDFNAAQAWQQTLEVFLRCPPGWRREGNRIVTSNDTGW